MRKNVLQAVRQLEGVDIPQSILDHRIHNQLREPQNLARQVERLRGANGLKIDKETTHGIVRWTRVHPRQGRRLNTSKRGDRALPKRDFLRSFVVSVLTGLRLKL
jgi:hypothetical protein